MRLEKVSLRAKPPANTKRWELDIDLPLSYAYDKGLRFGVLHRFNGAGWAPDVSLSEEDSSRFDELFGRIRQSDLLKYASLKETYSYISQPVPKIPEEKLSLRKESR